MATACRNDLDLEVKKKLIWNTRLPYENDPRTRPAFSLMGSEWCLRFVYHDCGGIYHVITLHQMSDGKILENKYLEKKKTFNCRTYITGTSDGERVVHEATDVVTGTYLWYLKEMQKDEIFKTLPFLYDCPEVKIVCKFYGHPPSTFQLQIETDNLSPVAHKKLSTRTEDKSVQVSPGFPRDISVQVSSEVPRDTESLSSDFSQLLEKEILPDVRLECGGRTFQAHRSVLAARSEVFRAMFQNGMLESETGAVKMEDMDVAALQKLLKFLYSGRPDDLSEDCTAELYEAADKYDVMSLKTACAYWIERNLTVENCVKYLKVSDSHSDQDLKAVVVSFMIGNPSVMKSEALFALSEELPLLANEVFKTYITSTVQ